MLLICHMRDINNQCKENALSQQKKKKQTQLKVLVFLVNKTLIYDFKNNLFSRKPEIVAYISCFGLFYDQNKDYNIHYIIFVCSYSVSKYNMSLNGSPFSKGERKGPQMSNICNQGGRGHLIVNYTGLKNFISSDSIS